MDEYNDSIPALEVKSVEKLDTSLLDTEQKSDLENIQNLSEPDIQTDSLIHQLDSGMSSLPESMHIEAVITSDTDDEEHSNISSDCGEEEEIVVSASIYPVANLGPNEAESQSQDSNNDCILSEKESPSNVELDEIVNENQLPETVTVLETEEGSKVYVVGTAHFSIESQEDVVKTIRMVRPDILVLELCKSRFSILQLSEENILKEAEEMNFSNMRNIIREQGKMQGILYMLLKSSTAHITKELGMAPGGEFRTAYQEIKSLPSCKVILGDRPIHITLSRALGSLSLWKKIRLMVHILLSKEPISKEDVEKCKKKDFIEELLKEMTGQFPEIHEVFVKERDIFLSKTLHNASNVCSIHPLNNPKTSSHPVVVGVVGIGHLAGIVENWKKVKRADIEKILTIPPRRTSEIVGVFVFRYSLYGILAFAAYKCLPQSVKTSIFSSVNFASTSDSYSHVTGGLIYVETSCAGNGIDESLYTCVPEGCRCVVCDEHCPCVLRSGCRYDDNLLCGNGPLYECNVDCQCNKSCRNRLIQNGPLEGLSVETISGKGLGLVSTVQLVKGSFVCEYAGEIIGVEEANKRFGQHDPHNYILIMNEYFGNVQCVTVIDPTIMGNIGRYINHSCDPNLAIVPVRINSLVPVAALFACRDIFVGDELCYSYENLVGSGPKTGANLSTTPCLCNTKLCKGFLPSNKLF